jgi:hypothetical protein
MIAVALRGKRRPRHVIKAMRKERLGKLHKQAARDELKDYDTAGYRLMEKVWGKPTR